MSFVLISGPQFRPGPALKRWIEKQSGPGSILSLNGDAKHALSELGPLVDENSLSEIDLGLEMDSIVASHAPRLERKLQELFSGSPQTWLAVFTELNFSSSIWKCYVWATAIREWCDQNPGVRTIVTCGVDRNLVQVLRATSREDIVVRDTATLLHRLYFGAKARGRLYWCWLSNFAKELFCFVAAKLRKRPRGLNEPHLSSLSVFINGSMRSGRLEGERFFGGLLNEPESNWVVLSSPVHQNSQRLRSFAGTLTSMRRASSARFLLAQSFARARDILTSYLGPRPDVSWSLIDDFLAGLGLHSFLPEVKRQFFFVDAPKQVALVKCLSRAHNELSTRSMVIPVFELVEGRAAVQSGHRGNVPAFGMQHGQSGPWGLWRFVNAQAALRKSESEASPKKILVEGEVYGHLLKIRGYEEVQVVGAPRIRSLPPVFRAAELTAKSPVLFLLDLHHWRNALQMTISIFSAQPKRDVVVRAHPKTQGHVENFVRNQGRGAAFSVCSASSLPHSMERLRPSQIIVTDTGATVEVGLAGWPVTLLRRPNSVLNSPLLVGAAHWAPKEWKRSGSPSSDGWFHAEFAPNAEAYRNYLEFFGKFAEMRLVDALAD